MAYVLPWWFEISVNSTVAAELMGVVGTAHDVRAGYFKYYPDKVPPPERTVELTDRFIAAHGAGRFAALGWFRDKDTQQPTLAFQTFDLLELFARLTPAALSDLWHDLKRRIQLYFLTVNALVIAVLLTGSLYYGYGDRHNSVKPCGQRKSRLRRRTAGESRGPAAAASARVRRRGVRRRYPRRPVHGHGSRGSAQIGRR